MPDCAILIIRFMTPDGVGEVHDFMPVIEGPATRRHRLVRNIRVVHGTMRFKIEIQPRFDCARKSHELELTEDGGVFRSDDLELTLHAIAPKDMNIKDSGIRGDRQHRRAARQLPAGLQPPVADQRGGQPGPPAGRRTQRGAKPRLAAAR